MEKRFDTTPLGRLTEEYAALVMLLKRERGITKEQAVEAVIASPITLAEKIDQILQIDGDKPFKSQLHLLRRTGNDDDSTPDNADEAVGRELAANGIYTQYIARERRRELRIVPRRAGFFTFLFFEMPKIREFAEATNVLECRYFPPRLRMASAVEHFFRERIKPAAATILPYFVRAEREGWRILPKAEYNLITEFRILCETVIAVLDGSNRRGEFDFAIRLRRIVNAFLLCHHHRENPKTIANAALKVLTVMGESDKIQNAVALISELLLPAPHGMSLHAVITALHIIECRRMLSIDDVINRGVKGVFSNCTFSCTPEVQHEIDAAVNVLIDRLYLLIEKREHASVVRSFLGFGPDDVLDTGLVMEFVYGSSVRRGGDPLAFAAHCTRNFIASYDQFLRGQIIIEGGVNARVFEEALFHAPMTELIAALDHIDGYHDASRDTHRDHSVHTQHVDDPTIPRIAAAFYDIAERLAVIHETGTSGGDVPPIPAGVLASGDIVIPNADRFVATRLLPTGKTVRATIRYLTALCYQAAHHLGDERIVSLLGDSSRDGEITKIKSQIAELATPFKYRAIRDL